MRITHLTCERHDLRLLNPYTIAYETLDRATNFVLCLHTDDGHRGYGCAAPDPVVTGETGDDVARVLDEIIRPALIGAEVFAYARILEGLRVELNSSALAMVDAALYDLLARRMGVPLYRLLGGYRDEIATSITISIVSLEETLRQTRRYVKEGFRILKIKGGLDYREDVERLRAVRRDFPELTLRFDGNQGYSLEQALNFVSHVQLLDIEILEQPTTVDDESLMGTLSRDTALPVMADESLKTLADAFRLTQHGFTDMINIKLQKVGGIWPSLYINSVARSAGNEVMVGCLDECSLGIATGLHFALSRPNIQYADLDGHLDFATDPFAGLFTLTQGILRPNGKPGLGVG